MTGKAKAGSRFAGVGGQLLYAAHRHADRCQRARNAEILNLVTKPASSYCKIQIQSEPQRFQSLILENAQHIGQAFRRAVQPALPFHLELPSHEFIDTDYQQMICSDKSSEITADVRGQYKQFWAFNLMLGPIFSKIGNKRLDPLVMARSQDQQT